MSTGIDVVIAAAGFGSRMRGISEDLHKGLLPFRDAPILWHIINEVPENLHVGLLLGHNGEQIRHFCRLAFPDRMISFVEIDDWSSEKSGTAYSLAFAKNQLNSTFWYLPCDGVFTESIFDDESTESVFFTASLPAGSSHKYQVFELADDGIIETSRFKVKDLLEGVAFTGIMRVVGKEEYFTSLKNSGAKEFATAIPIGARTRYITSWQDLGNEEDYLAARAATEKFDFTKPNEFTFVLPKIILKWWEDTKTPNEKLIKPEANKSVFPDGPKALGQFLAYDKATGSSFYDGVTPSKFSKLLSWLRNEFWDIQEIDISLACAEFYERKTLERVALMSSRLEGDEYTFSSVDGLPVKSAEAYLQSIDWQLLKDTAVASPIHGDLQFDNVIFDEAQGSFTLIDWRTTFGNQLVLGDIYYDFAKLLGGIRLNYKRVKENEFDVVNRSGSVTLSVPTASNAEALERELRLMIEDLGLDFRHVQKLVPIIYWNMAPLHAEPFAQFLWAFGMKQFETLN
jgi:CTP:phosphocholine cytidylyltransferase-like protein